MKNEVKATLALILTAFIWGLAFIGVQSALDNGWTTFPLLFVRGLIGGLCILIFTLKKKWWKDKNIIIAGVITGVLFFAGFAGQTYGQNLSTVPNSAFLTALNIVFIPFIEFILFKKKIKLKVILATLIALIGVGILTLDANFNFHIGDILIILGAVSFAGQIVYIKRCANKFDNLSLTAIQLFTMSILSLFFMLITKDTTFGKGGWVGVLYAAIFSSAIASVLQIYGLKYVSSSKGSLILVQESMIATYLSIWLLKEPFTLKILFGGCLLVLSILVIELDINFKKEKNSMKIE